MKVFFDMHLRLSTLANIIMMKRIKKYTHGGFFTFWGGWLGKKRGWSIPLADLRLQKEQNAIKIKMKNIFRTN